MGSGADVKLTITEIITSPHATGPTAPFAITQLLASGALLSLVRDVPGTPSTLLHPSPFTRHPTPNIHPTPNTQHPTPYTLRPTPIKTSHPDVPGVRLSLVDAKAPPTISALAPLLAAAAGGDVLTLAGSNFGRVLGSRAAGAPALRGVRIGGTACAETTWVSDSSLLCRTAGGVTAGHAVTLTIEALSPAAQLFTVAFRAPAPGSAHPANLPGAAATRLTLLNGAHFGAAGYTARARLGASGAERSAWLSDSCVATCAATGLGAALLSTVTVALAAGTIEAAVTFDAPALTHIKLHQEAQREAHGLPHRRALALTGRGFGPHDASPAARAGGSACESTNWAAESSITCIRARGPGTVAAVVVSVGDRRATPYTLQLAPYTLQLTPYTLQLTPYTLHPAPCTPHPTP